QAGAVFLEKGPIAIDQNLAGIFAAHREDALPFQPDAAPRLIEHMADGLFEEFGLSFLDNQDGILALAEIKDLAFNQRIYRVQAQNIQVGLTIDIRKAKAVQRPDRAVVKPALQ